VVTYYAAAIQWSHGLPVETMGGINVVVMNRIFIFIVLRVDEKRCVTVEGQTLICATACTRR